jgi:hypothetical protein
MRLIRLRAMVRFSSMPDLCLVQQVTSAGSQKHQENLALESSIKTSPRKGKATDESYPSLSNPPNKVEITIIRIAA